ncbi:MAG: WecB/TagA/CpsF family glycosyltransferase [Bacteroidetes bacterium]|nr:WecB/TagA/CpsF family glycosyltransferase [Bacteroidota bacterium]
MSDQTYPLYGVHFCATNYVKATDKIISNAISHHSYTVSALAVHGLIEAVRDHDLKKIVNEIDLVVPDGQPIRWALNSFYKLDLKDRVSGPDLTLYVLEKANENKLLLYLYGSTKDTLDRLVSFISHTYPGIKICGVHADRFREASEIEDAADIKKINESGAHIVFVGRGCPRQEKWVADHKNKINAAMMAIGAAFDFHAGTVKRAPKWMQNSGLEWLYRMIQEPKKMWKRNLDTFPLFIYLFFKHKLSGKK